MWMMANQGGEPRILKDVVIYRIRVREDGIGMHTRQEENNQEQVELIQPLI